MPPRSYKRRDGTPAPSLPVVQYQSHVPGQAHGGVWTRSIPAVFSRLPPNAIPEPVAGLHGFPVRGGEGWCGGFSSSSSPLVGPASKIVLVGLEEGIPRPVVRKSAAFLVAHHPSSSTSVFATRRHVCVPPALRLPPTKPPRRLQLLLLVLATAPRPLPRSRGSSRRRLAHCGNSPTARMLVSVPDETLFPSNTGR